MTGLLIKLVVCPITIIIAWMLFPNVDFGYWYQPIILGVLLAFVGHLMELLLLNEKTVVFSTFMDLVASIIIVYYVSIFFVNTYVTFWGAVLTSVLLGVTEIVQHRWLVQNGQTKKEPTTTQ
ncbi:DUF2512 family protein [Aquibacillus halophilus]|uniref:DUF2512 family protein n=1 Tax=Aquibacillus halophilus TaxID=930132 RepID=A0A6A8DJ43_9BACI|nr:DUF2512 family protein [Aquibacillus halophilus]MRH43771.1 DUF2512 family protein [Aquibacillus halophilus]